MFDRQTDRQTGLTGYPSIDKPWLRYYDSAVEDLDIPDCSVYDLMEKYTKEFDDECAIEYLKIKISYKELREKINTTARALKAIGVKQGDIVSVCLPNIPEVVYLVYAINKIGAVANLLDVRCGEIALKTVVLDAKSSVLFSLDSVTERFDKFLCETSVKTAISISPIESLSWSIRTIIRMSNCELRPVVPKRFISWKKFWNKGKKYTDSIDSICHKNNEAFIAYTGGTTGIPKGVIATNENMNAQFLMQNTFGHNVGCGDRALVIAPPWTYYGLCNSINNCLCSGMCLVLIPKFNNDEFGQMIVKHRPNYIVTVPAALLSIIGCSELKKADLSFIKCLCVGADKLDEKTEMQVNLFLKARGCESLVQKGYGMTEVMAAASCTKKGVDGVGSVGIPCPNVVISAFIEKEGLYEECNIGEQGEIAIQSKTIMKGYFGPAEIETKDIVKRHADGTVWAHTGDVGYVGKDGRIYIVGRIKRMFTRNGFKVFPATIETCILKVEEVSQAAVVSVKDDMNGNITKAYIVLKDGIADKKLIQSKIEKTVADELYDYEIPDIYEFVDKLPLTGMGKIDYRALEELA